MDGFVDLGMFDGTGEELPGGGLASAPKRSYQPTPVGKYLSQQRTVKVKTITSGEFAGHLEFEVEHTEGLVDQVSGKIYNKTFPLKRKLTTIPFDGDTTVAAYLRAFPDVNVEGLNTLAEVVAAVQSTVYQPVVVFVGGTDKRVQGEDGTWTGGTLRTKDFLQPDGTYANSVERDGRVYVRKEVISSYEKA